MEIAHGVQIRGAAFAFRRPRPIRWRWVAQGCRASAG
jgi:hypothetical protein